MKVMVTGGSGFVGSHIVAALVHAGHACRLLVRSRDKTDRALAPFGHPEVEVVVGDVLDEASVREALAGCDAVLHAANVYTMDPRKVELMQRVNVESTELVLRLAHEQGCDPIVHVSSVVAIMPSATEVVPSDPPLGAAPARTYPGSKLAAEVVARRFQDAGAPVVTTYPGSVYGPHDPGPGDMIDVLRAATHGAYSFHMPSAGFNLVDVRWLARAHAAVFTKGLGARRVLMGGVFVPFPDFVQAIRDLTGHWLPTPLPGPRWLVLPSSWCLDRLQAVSPVRLPVNYAGTWYVFAAAPTDDRIARELVGPHPPVADMLRDAMRWAYEAGHLTARQVGRLAGEGG